jgi:hypothetical protein
MQQTNSFAVQNIAGRITHGLVGLDIFLNEKKDNDYLKDFLTLKDQEIEESLVTSSQTMLIPTAKGELSKEIKDLIQCVGEAQQLVLNLDKMNSEEKIVATIHQLGAKVELLYEALQSR